MVPVSPEGKAIGGDPVQHDPRIEALWNDESHEEQTLVSPWDGAA